VHQEHRRTDAVDRVKEPDPGLFDERHRRRLPAARWLRPCRQPGINPLSS
jgi:hypothetical protein